VTSAAVALVFCSLGFWWLHASRSKPATSLAHQVEPAQPRVYTPPEAPLPTLASPSENRKTETTTNAIAVPTPELALHRSKPTAPKPRSATPARAVSQPKEQPAPEPAAAPAKRASLADWDERLSTAPVHASGAPAGRIDARDFH
jgi:hypothetical protein